MYSQVSVQTHMQTLMHMQMHMRSHFDLKCFLLFAVVQQCASNMASMGCYPISPYSFEPVLPPDATKEQILEALQLWDVPIEAYPHAKRWDVNYIVNSPPDLPKIHVHLLRQCFVTKPKTQRHSYFSFFATGEFPIGPVDNPIPPGQNVPHRGYNHSNAKVAFGEAQILAGWKKRGVCFGVVPAIPCAQATVPAISIHFERFHLEQIPKAVCTHHPKSSQEGCLVLLSKSSDGY